MPDFLLKHKWQPQKKYTNCSILSFTKNENFDKVRGKKSAFFARDLPHPNLKDDHIIFWKVSRLSYASLHKNGHGDNFFAIGPIELKNILARDYRWPDRNPVAYDISGKQTN